MSKKDQPPRVVLGPVAKTLIQGKEEIGQQALDKAITDLIYQVENPPAAAPQGGDADALAERIDALAQMIEAQNEALTSLKTLMVLEQKLTRVFVSSYFAEDDDQQQELIQVANAAVEKHIIETGLLSAKERERMRLEEDAVQNAILREIQRGDIEPEPRRQEQLEL